MVRGGRDASFTMLAGVLFALVAVAALFFMLLVRAPSRGGAVPQIGPLTGTACPTGSGSPACFQATIVNIGSGPGRIVCDVIAPDGATATFGNGSPEYATPVDVPMAPNESFSVTVITKPIGDASAIKGTPMVGCNGD